MASRNRPFGSAIAVALLAVLALASPAAVAQQQPIVLFTSKEQIPLKTYAIDPRHSNDQRLQLFPLRPDRLGAEGRDGGVGGAVQV